MNGRKGFAFLALGFSFLAIGLTGRSAFLGLGVAFLAVGLGFQVRGRREAGNR
jgi:hypothetical protein